jgi:hypothetical protein
LRVESGEVFRLERGDRDAVKTAVIQRDAAAHAEKPRRTARAALQRRPDVKTAIRPVDMRFEIIAIGQRYVRRVRVGVVNQESVGAHDEEGADIGQFAQP